MFEVKDNSLIVVALTVKKCTRRRYVGMPLGDLISSILRERLIVDGKIEYKPKIIMRVVKLKINDDGNLSGPNLTKIKSIRENTNEMEYKYLICGESYRPVYYHVVEWRYTCQTRPVVDTLEILNYEKLRYKEEGLKWASIYPHLHNEVKRKIEKVEAILTNLERSIKAQLKRKFPQYELKQIKDNETVRYELIKKENNNVNCNKK